MKLLLIIFILIILKLFKSFSISKKVKVLCPEDKKDEENKIKNPQTKNEEEDDKEKNEKEEKKITQTPVKEEKDLSNRPTSTPKIKSLKELIETPTENLNTFEQSIEKKVVIKDKKNIESFPEGSPELVFTWENGKLSLHGLWADSIIYKERRMVSVKRKEEEKKSLPEIVAQLKKRVLSKNQKPDPKPQPASFLKDPFIEELKKVWAVNNGFIEHEYSKHRKETGFDFRPLDYFQMLYHLIKEQKHEEIEKMLNDYRKNNAIFILGSEKTVSIQKKVLEEKLSKITNQEIIVKCNAEYYYPPKLFEIRFVYKQNYDKKTGFVNYLGCYANIIDLL